VGTSGVGGVLGSDDAGEEESEWDGDGGSDSGDEYALRAADTGRVVGGIGAEETVDRRGATGAADAARADEGMPALAPPVP